MPKYSCWEDIFQNWVHPEYSQFTQSDKGRSRSSVWRTEAGRGGRSFALSLQDGSDRTRKVWTLIAPLLGFYYMESLSRREAPSLRASWAGEKFFGCEPAQSVENNREKTTGLYWISQFYFSLTRPLISKMIPWWFKSIFSLHESIWIWMGPTSQCLAKLEKVEKE
jgi:hypothetical protein